MLASGMVPIRPAEARQTAFCRAIALAALLVGVACSSPPPEASKSKGMPYPAPAVNPAGDEVAKIGEVTFTTAELQTRLNQITPFRRVMLKDNEKKREFVDNELRMELLAQEGWRRGLHEDPKIIAQLKRLIINQVMTEELKKLEPQLKVTDVDLHKAYKARFDEFNKPAKVRLSQIVRYVNSDAERKKAKQLLSKVKRDVLAAERKNDVRAFSRFAKEHTQDEATKNAGGDLSFLTRAQLEERYGAEVTKFMFDDVKVGDMGIADAENAVVLVKKTGRRRGVERTLEMVKPQVRSQVIADKRKKLFDGAIKNLMKERGITVDWSKVDTLEIDDGGTQSGTPASRPQGASPKPAPTPAPEK